MLIFRHPLHKISLIQNGENGYPDFHSSQLTIKQKKTSLILSKAARLASPSNVCGSLIPHLHRIYFYIYLRECGYSWTNEIVLDVELISHHNAALGYSTYFTATRTIKLSSYSYFYRMDTSALVALAHKPPSVFHHLRNHVTLVLTVPISTQQWKLKFH